MIRGQTGQHYPKDVGTKITQVENNLAAWVQVDGQPSRWTLADRMKFYHTHGISIAVIKNYRIEWEKGYGWADSAAHRPVTTATLFLAGSISKSINAVGILKLVQAGKVDLYTDINHYLKSWKFPYDSLSKGRKITLANLLSHTAGLTVHGFAGYEQGSQIPTLVDILNGKKPANSAPVRSMAEPSTQFEYSGGGTTISQLIIQDVTGQRYDEYMWNNVLKPMGMMASSYIQPPPPARQYLLAAGYYSDGRPVKGKYHVYPEQAAAGLWTNANDLAEYVIETQLALLGKSQKVLTQKMTELRLIPYLDSHSALGVFILNDSGVRYFTHGGDDEGFVAQYIGSMTGGDGVVVMSNGTSMALLNEIINSVAITYHWKNFYSPVTKREIRVSDSTLQTYTGQYTMGNSPRSIVKKSDGLYLVIGAGGYLKWRLHFTDATHFFVLEEKADGHFIVDPTKKVTGFAMDQDISVKTD